MDLSVDGQTVFAATGGRPFDVASPAVVLVHGAGMDHTVWSFQARYLAHHGRAVLAVDLPGHGRSAGAALSTIADMAAWLARLLDAAGIATAGIAGHSMGALVTLEAAARAPGRVRALALLAVGAPMVVHPALLAAAADDEALAQALITSWAHGGRGTMGGHAVPGLWMAGGTRRLLERCRPGVLRRDLAACAEYAGAMAAAAGVRCPALLVLGAEDRMTPPATAAGIGGAIAGAETMIVAGSGHMIMSEFPDTATDALGRIL